MEKNIGYLIGIFIILFILYSVFFSDKKEHLTLFPWNVSTRLNNYIYDIRGYPNLFTCYDGKYNMPYPCMYLFNNKYNVSGQYVQDPMYQQYRMQRRNNNI